MTARAIALALLAVLTLPLSAAQPPRFTEEREAAALHFVKKHLPELSPLLDELKKANRSAYEQQVRETFRVTELLADIKEDAKRYELQLSMWKAENKALVLVAKLATPRDDDRKAVEQQLQALAKELVKLEVQSLEHQAAVLERELAETKDELAKARENFDRSVKGKFDEFIEKARKRRGS